MSLADDIRSALVDDWQPDVTPPDPPWLTKVRKLERSHAEAVALLQTVQTEEWLAGTNIGDAVKVFLADHDKRTGTGEPDFALMRARVAGCDAAVKVGVQPFETRPDEVATMPDPNDPESHWLVLRPVEASPVCQEWCWALGWRNGQHARHGCSPACRDLGRPVRPGKGTP